MRFNLFDRPQGSPRTKAVYQMVTNLREMADSIEKDVKEAQKGHQSKELCDKCAAKLVQLVAEGASAIAATFQAEAGIPPKLVSEALLSSALARGARAEVFRFPDDEVPPRSMMS